MKSMNALFMLFCCMWSIGLSAKGIETMKTEEKVFRTGLTGKGSRFAVSPDGGYLAFNTRRLEHGLQLLDLRSGRIMVISMEPGRHWEMPRWSADGKQIVAVSTAVRDNHYIVGDMQVILLDPKTWQQRTISSGDGVKIFPFFSADSKTIYHFKGKKRESGATPASRYDLYAIDLSSGQETQLTDEEFYQVGGGDEQAGVVLFEGNAYPRSKRFGNLKDQLGQEGRPFLATYDMQRRSLRLFPVDQSSGAFYFGSPERDKVGNVYFVAAKAREGGGNYHWFVFRATREGKAPVALTELPAGLEFNIAKNTGEIYVMDKQGEEIIFRRLNVLAEH